MKQVRPRETRLPYSEAHSLFSQSPYVLRVKDRKTTDFGVEQMELEVVKVADFDIEFSRNFFYRVLPSDNPRQLNLNLLMVPLALNGDE